jgi:flagellar basal-body rod modification protein FlgD
MAITGISSILQTAGISQQAAGAAQSKISMGKEDFLKILIEQIKYQDPLEPMKPEQFLSQLSQLTQVEQLQNIAASLDAMKAAADKGNIMQWLSVIGKKINVDGNTLSAGDEVTLTPAGDYDRVLLMLQNVNDGSITEVAFNKGESLSYTHQNANDVAVAATAIKDGKIVGCTTSLYRIVKGLQMNDSGIVLTAGNGDQYSTSSVKKIKG